jgi:hypothetical protein
MTLRFKTAFEVIAVFPPPIPILNFSNQIPKAILLENIFKKLTFTGKYLPE